MGSVSIYWSSKLLLRKSVLTKGSWSPYSSARATSAAFPHFKIFKKPEGDRGLCDGGVYHNCPVQVASTESRLIWDDVGEHPDILLSLGTGYDPDAKRAKPSFSRRQKRHSHMFKEAKGLVNAYLQTINDTQTTWDTFVRESATRCRESPELESRYIRLNPRLSGDVPKLDERGKVDELERLVDAWVPEAREVAHRLIASCFYFKPGVPEKRDTGYRICGEHLPT